MWRSERIRKSREDQVDPLKEGCGLWICSTVIRAETKESTGGHQYGSTVDSVQVIQQV